MSCCSRADLRLDDFNPKTGEGALAFRIQMIAADGSGPFLFPGRNAITLFFAQSGRMAFTYNARPTGFSHSFKPLEAGGVNPPLAIVVQTPHLLLGEETTATIVLDKPAAKGLAVPLQLRFDSKMDACCNGSADNGVSFASTIKIARGQRCATFPVRFAPTRCGNQDATARLVARDGEGNSHLSNPFDLHARVLAESGSLTDQMTDLGFVWWETNSTCTPASIGQGPWPNDVGGCVRLANPPAASPPKLGLWITTGHCSPGGTTNCYPMKTTLQGPAVSATTTWRICASANAAAVAGPQTMTGYQTVTTYTQTNTVITVSNVDSCM
jgi:hypothetical protein